MAVPNIFGTATAAIPLSQLDTNFATAITLGNTAVYLGNTTTSLGNLTLTNVTISSGTSNITTNVATVTGTLPEANGGTGTTTGYYGFKNRIINGAMVIDQRNAGASVATPNGYTLDRFRVNQTVTGKLNTQQNQGSVTPPIGFSNYLGVTSLSAYSVLTGDAYWIDQAIEGFNFADMAWGTASASTVTLSFRVYSSLTGTFGGSLRNSAANRSYPFTYSIPVANTWTTISVTIAGDTTGTWIGATNGVGLYVSWGLGVGSTFSGTAGAWAGSNFISATGATSVVGTSSATFYITGVQLEKGSTATSFDYRPYGTELALCQRYCQVIRSTGSNTFLAIGFCYSTSAALVSYVYPVTPRVPATGLTVNAANNFACFQATTSATNVVTFAYNSASPVGVTLQPQGMSGLVAGDGTQMIMNASAVIEFTGMEL
jgi:hypothetical protein